jgi:nicotinate-nucleotide adenylyltransferase
MTTRRRVGILGGTFDPIHCGHLDAGTAAQRALTLDQILVLPSNLPPHRLQPVASSFHRFAMVILSIVGRPGWRALDLELQDDGPSFTAVTLRRFRADGFSPTELFFITGADAFVEIGTWKDYPALLDLAHFAVVSRPGIAAGDLHTRLPALASRMREPHTSRQSSESTMIYLIDAPTADVSSTAIRLARARGDSIAGLVSPLVQQHIEQHALYEHGGPVAEHGHHSIEQAAGGLHGEK